MNGRIGGTVRALLAARGMTARQLGDAIGQPETTVSKLTRGRQSWQADDLFSAAQALDVELSTLWLSPYDALREAGLNQEAALKLLGGIGVDPQGPGGDEDRSGGTQPAESMPEAVAA